MSNTALNEIITKEIRQHFHNRNMLMLEAVISAMLDVDGAYGVARILREHADQLEEFH